MRVLIAVAALLLAGEAFAQARPAPGDTIVRPTPTVIPVSGSVGVEVMVVRGTKLDTRVDPELKALIRQLSFTSYTGFDLIDTQKDDLSVGEEATFAIEGGRKLKVQLVDRDDTAARLRLRLLGADGTKQLDTTVAVHRNRTFMVAGPKIGDDVLILPVTARY